MKIDKYVPNRRGVKDLLHKPEVRGHIFERAERVAEAARADYAEHPPHSGEVEVVVTSMLTDDGRARSAVIARHPAALPIEADRRPLGGAMDAARG